MASQANSLLSRCRSCGYVFPSRVIEISSSQNVSFTGVTEPCPRCGGRAQILDGTYDFDVEGIAQLISGPDISREVYRQFLALVEGVKDKQIKSEEFSKRVEAISPSLAASIKKYLPNDANSLAAFLMLLWTLLTYDGNKDEKETKNVTVINNYNRNVYVQQPYIPNVTGYNREIRIPPIIPSGVSNITKEESSADIQRDKHTNTLKPKKKQKKKNRPKTANVKVDTTTFASTKETVKRLLRKG